MPTLRDLTRGASERQLRSRVLIRFQQPVLRPQAWEFHRLKLTRPMLRAGEDRQSQTPWRKVGVVGIEVAPDWIINPQDPPGMQLVSACLLVMDRRYRQEVLAAVYRTAGNVADDIGVRIK